MRVVVEDSCLVLKDESSLFDHAADVSASLTYSPSDYNDLAIAFTPTETALELCLPSRSEMGIKTKAAAMNASSLLFAGRDTDQQRRKQI